MIIRILLIAATCLLVGFLLKQRISTRTQAWAKLGVLLLFTFAVIAILFPQTTNDLAHSVGVGRGADLLLYSLTIIFLSSLVQQYMARRDEQTKLIRLTRHLAILEANQNPHNLRPGAKLKGHVKTARQSR